MDAEYHNLCYVFSSNIVKNDWYMEWILKNQLENLFFFFSWDSFHEPWDKAKEKIKKDKKKKKSEKENTNILVEEILCVLCILFVLC